MNTDLILDDNHRMIIRNGTFLTGPSNDQETEQILISNRGDWKQWPLTGCDLDNLVNASASITNLNTFRRTVNLQMEMDNKKVLTLTAHSLDSLTLETEET